MSDMKLILERWDKFRLDEEFDSCEGAFTIGAAKAAMDLSKYLEDEQLTARRAKELETTTLKKHISSAAKVLQFFKSAGISAAGGAAGATVGTAIGATVGGLTPLGPVGAAAGAYIGKELGDSLGSALGKLFVNASKAEDRISGKHQQFLELFCVDAETLDLIEDKYQAKYIQETDIVARLQNYISTANDDAPLPDITKDLTDWLNTKSDYASAETDVIPKE